jgi:hypothetical protein
MAFRFIETPYRQSTVFKQKSGDVAGDWNSTARQHTQPIEGSQEKAAASGISYKFGRLISLKRRV